MLIIEIHVDNTEKNTPSTRAANVREDAQSRPSTKNNQNSIYQLVETIKTWFNDREKNSSHTHGL